jgi:hypothetical protein
MSMVVLSEPQNVSELMMIKSLLDGSGIGYIVHNEHVSSLYPGLPALGSQVIVHERDLLRAEVLLSRLPLAIRDVSAQA